MIAGYFVVGAVLDHSHCPLSPLGYWTGVPVPLAQDNETRKWQLSCISKTLPSALILALSKNMQEVNG